MLDVDWMTLTSAAGGEAMELEDVAIISNCLVYLNLEKRISRPTSVTSIYREVNLVTGVTNNVDNFQLNPLDPLLHFSFQLCQKSP